MTGAKKSPNLQVAVIISIMIFIQDVFGQSSCGGNATASETAGTITSPNYPNFYPSNTNCLWIITADLSERVVMLNLLDFALENSPTCNYDNVTIYDGNSTNSPVIQKLCGSISSTQLTSTGSCMTVMFSSDSSQNNTGFKFEYSSQNKTALCGDINLVGTGTAKNITSPNYPNNYPSNMNCWWTIKADLMSKVIVLNVLDFDLYTSPSCMSDSVSIYSDRGTTGLAKLAKLCSQTSDEQYISWGPYMTVVFRSDGTASSRGFNLEYFSRDKAAVCSTSTLWASTATNYITSPNYPGDYYSHTDCQWHITADTGSRVIVLNVVDFVLEWSSTSCSNAYDYVSIYDGSSTSSPLIQQLCNEPASTQFRSTGSTMTIKFHTDGSSNFKGFKLSYTTGAGPAPCAADLSATSSTQYITLPNYPDNYLSNTICQWQITADTSSRVIVLKVLDFYLDGSSGSCSNAVDYVSIYDGSSSSDPLIQKLCGQPIRTQVTSTGSTMYVLFHSDGSNNYRGFKLEYTSSDKSAVCTGNTLTAYDTPNELISPNYPSNYPSNVNRQWCITADFTLGVVVLELTDFSLEGSQPSCYNDYVKIYDGPITFSNLIATLCGSEYSGRYESTGSVMTVVFHSELGGNYAGFRFTYQSQFKGDSRSLSAGSAVAIAICTVALLFLIVGLVILVRRKMAQRHSNNSGNTGPVQNGGTTSAPVMVYATNNQPAATAPYVGMQNPQMMPMGAPGYNTGYYNYPYPYAMPPGTVPQGQPPLPGQGPGQGLGPTPGQGLGSTPGQGLGPTPGQGLGPTPGQGLGPTPGQGLGSTPGQGLGPTPEQGLGPTPEQGLGSTPGTAQGTEPAQGTGPAQGPRPSDIDFTQVGGAQTNQGYSGDLPRSATPPK